VGRGKRDQTENININLGKLGRYIFLILSGNWGKNFTGKVSRPALKRRKMVSGFERPRKEQATSAKGRVSVSA